MPHDELAGKIATWVERSGFALELRVARAFAQAPHLPREPFTEIGPVEVTPAKMYRDRTENKWRETDMLAEVHSQRDQNRVLRVVAECKSGAGKPWVVFTDPHRSWVTDDDAFSGFLFRWAGALDVHKIWKSARGAPCLPAKVTGYALAEARFTEDQNQKQPTDPDVPYRAVRQAMAAAMSLHEEERADADTYVRITVPIVVTAAPIFECSLSQTGEVLTVPVNYAALYAQPEADRTPLAVQVMTEDHLRNEWVPGLDETLRNLSWI